MNWGRGLAPRRLTACCAALILGLLAIGSPSQADDSKVRDFIPRGTAVHGIGTPSNAPTIVPGLYHDTIGPVGDPSGVKYYLVEHTPKAVMYFSATARPPKYDDKDGDDGLTVSVRTQNWDECASWAHLRDANYGLRGLSVSDVSIGLPDDGEVDPCAGQGQVVLEVRRGDSSTETPDATKPLDFELQIVEEPQAAHTESLPPPDETSIVNDEGVAPRPTKPVTGGPGFADAATLEPGTARDSIRPGEVHFYRIRVGWGQQLSTSVRLQPDSALQDEIDEDDGLETTLRSYNPVRAEIEDSDPQTYVPDEPRPFHSKLPEVRFRNRESENNWPVSMAGYYYLSLELARDDGDFAVPVEVSVAVTGKQSGRPDYVGLATPSPPQSSDESGTKLAGLDRPISIGIASVGGVLVLIGVVLGALFLRRTA
ncbi:hypothetical protein [Flindersiella endophytica]